MSDLREALLRIRDYPVNGNSEPDRMAEAIENMQAVAAAALEGDPLPPYPEVAT